VQPKKYNSDLSHRWKRQSLRMKTHNYGWSGTYFVTIRAVQREPIFETAELRTILTETWEALPQRFEGVTLDEFVIMPDHIHFIIWLEGNVEKPATLGDVVGAYKSLTTVAWLRHIKATGMECSGIIWQRNYYERDIRDADELEQTRQYIRNNPIKQQQQNT
jgi:REP element-mobilizing transposase RayT